MLVSIIIVNYNAGDRLSHCVRSAMDTCPNAELIIVDNASTDGSITTLMAAHPHESSLHLIRSQTNDGFAVACNRGAACARGEFLFFLNPDCVLLDDAVSQLLVCLQDNPAAGMAGGLLLNADGSEQAGGRRMVPTPKRTLVRAFNLGHFEKRYPDLFVDFNLHNQPLPEDAIEVEAISGACMMVGREAFVDVGGLDEDYFLHCEDLDWCMRFRLKGWEIFLVPSARIIHHQGACSRQRPIFVEWHKHRGMLRFYRKFFRDEYSRLFMWLVTAMVWMRFSLLALATAVRRLLGTIESKGKKKPDGANP